MQALVVLRAALGAVVWMAPRTTTRLLGIEHTVPSQAALLARVFAVRDLALAYGLGASGPGSRRLWLRAGMASDVGDAVAGLLAARRRDVPRAVGALLVASGMTALAGAAAAIRSEPPAG